MKAAVGKLDLPKEREEDLAFYKAILGNRTDFDPLLHQLNADLQDDAKFISSINRLRLHFTVNARKLLLSFFGSRGRRREQVVKYEEKRSRSVTRRDSSRGRRKEEHVVKYEEKRSRRDTTSSFKFSFRPKSSPREKSASLDSNLIHGYSTGYMKSTTFNSLDMKRRYHGTHRLDKIALKHKKRNYGEGLSELFENLKPPTLFDDIENEILLEFGDRFFPSYRANIKKMAESVDAAVKNKPFKALVSDFLKTVDKWDPELFSSFHKFAPNAEKHARRGELFKLNNNLVATNTTRRYCIDRYYAANMAVVKFVLTSYDDDDFDPIDLAEALVERDIQNAKAFIVSGKSAINPKRMLRYHMVGASDSGRRVNR